MDDLELIEMVRPRSVGALQATLSAIRACGFEGKLAQLGLNRPQIAAAVGIHRIGALLWQQEQEREKRKTRYADRDTTYKLAAWQTRTKPLLADGIFQKSGITLVCKVRNFIWWHQKWPSTLMSKWQWEKTAVYLKIRRADSKKTGVFRQSLTKLSAARQCCTMRL